MIRSDGVKILETILDWNSTTAFLEGGGVKDPVRLLGGKNYFLLSMRTKFKSWHPQAGRREPSPSSCPLTSTHASRHTCKHTHEVSGCVCAAKIPQFKHGKPWVCTPVSGCPVTVQSGILTKDTAQSVGKKLSEATQPQYYLVLNLFLFLMFRNIWLLPDSHPPPYIQG